MAIETKIKIQSSSVEVSAFAISDVFYRFLKESGCFFNEKNLKGELIVSRDFDCRIDLSRIGISSNLYGYLFQDQARKIHIYFENAARSRALFKEPFHTNVQFSLHSIGGGMEFMKELFSFLIKQDEFKGCQITYTPEDYTNKNNIVVNVD